MATINNIAASGLSGRVDQFVYRQRFGRTIVSKKPRATAKISEGQFRVRHLFTQAAAYAKVAISDAALKLLYSAKAGNGRSAYNVAFSDFLHPPQIGEINASAYNGSVGSSILATITDEGRVVSVQVKIQRHDGSLLEEGEASPEASGINWRYVATRLNETPTGSRIIVSATDLPGHTSQKQINV